MTITLKKWPASGIVSSLIGVVALLAVQSTVLSGIVSLTAVIAGSFGALVLNYLHHCGYSILGSSWWLRLGLLAVFVVAVILGGSTAMLFGIQ